MAKKRIAIMTGGGDCPGLNAVIRAAVKVGIDNYGWEMLGIEDAFNGLVNLNYHSPHGNLWLHTEDVRGILARGGTILGTSNRSDPFHYVTHLPNGETQVVDVSDRVMENYRKMGLDGLISIGGDGSMRITQRLAAKGMKVVGVPKTIDNDLDSTDQTFGFDSALHVVTEAIDRLRDTAESHDRVMLVEVMGRDAGWIALQAGISGGADAILLPEIPYRMEPLLKRLAERRQHGQSYSIIVVSEGAKPAGGEASVISHHAGAMPRLGGAAQRVADELEKRFDAEARVTVLGHVQRGGSPTTFDRVLGTRFGHHAAELVERGEFGRMVALRGGEIVSVSLEEAVAQSRHVPINGQLVATARAMGVVFGDEI
jgi:6-phosphofructokinase 1